MVCCVQESPIQDPVLSEFLDDLTKKFGEDQGTAKQRLSRHPRAASAGTVSCSFFNEGISPLKKLHPLN